MSPQAIRNLRPGMEGVELEVELLELGEARQVETRSGLQHTLREGRIHDKTGEINLTVWNERLQDVEDLQPGERLRLHNCFVSSYKGVLSVNLGRDSSVERI